VLGSTGLIPSCNIKPASTGPISPHYLINVSGSNAQGIIDALDGAGVKGQVLLGATNYATKTVSCSESFVLGHAGSSCQITAVNP
jgi:hypothetical protein